MTGIFGWNRASAAYQVVHKAVPLDIHPFQAVVGASEAQVLGQGFLRCPWWLWFSYFDISKQPLRVGRKLGQHALLWLRNPRLPIPFDRLTLLTRFQQRGKGGCREDTATQNLNEISLQGG